MENPIRIEMDDANIYSLSGRAYPRVRARNQNHHRERRLPFVKRVRAKGAFYYYFVGPDRSINQRLPSPDDIGFDHAYLSEIAKMEGEGEPTYIAPSRGIVYFIGCEHAIKIGTTINLEKRVAAIQSHSPVPVEVFATVKGGYDLEDEYHRRFAEHRLHGEWFDPHPDILAEIERLSDAP